MAEVRAECGREVRAAVADHELDLVRLAAEVHDQVAGLLGGPFPSGMHGDSQDADSPGGVLDHGQDIGLGAAEQAGREEAACQDRVGLGALELRPDRPGSARRGSIPAFFRVSHTVDAATFTPSTAAALRVVTCGRA
jgi:hypothetical protein